MLKLTFKYTGNFPDNFCLKQSIYQQQWQQESQNIKFG